MENYKIRIPNADISRQVQEKAFRLGYKWRSGGIYILEIPEIDWIILYGNSSMQWRRNSQINPINDTTGVHLYPEISYQDFLALPEQNEQTNKTTQIEEKIMGEITLNCIKEPQNAKNITVGRGYTGILINSDDTQVDTWNEASHFLCTNNKGTEAKYKLSLFERVAPPEPAKLTMDQLIAALDVKANRVVVEYNGNEVDVVDRGYENSLSEGSSGCSCGIRSIDELGSLYDRLSNESYSHIEEIVEDFDEYTLIEKLFEKIVVDAIEDVSAAFVLMSTVEDDSDVCEIVDRICEERNGWSTDYARNPNSGNDIKAWLIPVNTES